MAKLCWRICVLSIVYITPPSWLLILSSCISTRPEPTLYVEYVDLISSYGKRAALLVTMGLDAKDATEDVRATYIKAQQDGKRSLACILFLSAIHEASACSFAAADQIMSDAIALWPENIEFVMLKILCLDKSGQSADADLMRDARGAKKPLPPYLHAMLTAVDGGNVHEHERESLSSRQVEFIELLEGLKECRRRGDTEIVRRMGIPI